MTEHSCADFWETRPAEVEMGPRDRMVAGAEEERGVQCTVSRSLLALISGKVAGEA